MEFEDQSAIKRKIIPKGNKTKLVSHLGKQKREEEERRRRRGGRRRRRREQRYVTICVWISMDGNGFVWICMDGYGLIWILVDSIF